MQALGENDLDHTACFNPQPRPALENSSVTRILPSESTYLQDMESVPLNLVEHRLTNIPEAHHRCGLPAKAGQESTPIFL